jgi:hypothetical protein
MKKVLNLTLVSSIAFIAGAITSAHFMLPGGLFGNPQNYNAYILQRDITLNDGVKTISLPAGVAVNQYQNIDGQPYFSLHFYNEPFSMVPFEKAEKWEYFYIQK